MTLSEYKKKVEASVEEYFGSGDLTELQRSIQEIDCPEYSYELVKRSISMSLDRSDREREMISQMLSELYPDTLSSNMIGKGFERIFQLADELQKDVPLCRDFISKFLARGVLDEVLPPSFLSDIVVRNLGGDIVDHAIRMLSREHGSAMLEHAWGPGDGRPAAELK
ncbi:MRF2, partial [Symbiodinium microadriaticum]